MRLLPFIFLVAFVYQCNAISSGVYVNSITNFGYQVAVLCPVIMCSAVVISPKGVATTATCINYLTPPDVQVRLGSVQYYTGGYLTTISQIVMHPLFSQSTFDYNIALLELTTPLTSALMTQYSIKVLPVATAMPPWNSYGAVTAYGSEDVNLDLPNTMKLVQLTLFQDCSAYKTITSSMFCAGDTAGNKDMCPGDQGAPYVYQGQVVGIYNWGCSCGTQAAKGRWSTPIFTNMQRVNSWITATTANF